MVQRVLITLDVVAVVRAFVETDRALHDVRSANSGFAMRKIREQYLLRLTLLAGETKIPLSGG